MFSPKVLSCNKALSNKNTIEREGRVFSLTLNGELFQNLASSKCGTFGQSLHLHNIWTDQICGMGMQNDNMHHLHLYRPEIFSLSYLGRHFPVGSHHDPRSSSLEIFAHQRFGRSRKMM